MARLRRSEIREILDKDADAQSKTKLRQQKEAEYIRRRKEYLPNQIIATRAKLQALITEAKRYNMLHILTEEERDDN